MADRLPPRAHPIKKYFLLNINIVVRTLIISAIVWESGVALLGPIFALFVVGFIEGATPTVVGLAAATFLITKSLFQIPIATVLDKIRGEKDDYWILLIGSLILATMPIFYLFISTPLQLYIVQFISGLLSAATYPSWYAIFTHHIDKGKTGTEWGIYFTLNDLVAAAAASMGGALAETIGFEYLIIIVVIISVIGASLRAFIWPYIRKPRKVKAK